MPLTRVNFVVVDDEIRAVTFAEWTNDTGYANVPSYATGSDGVVYKSTAPNGVDNNGVPIGVGVVDPATDSTGVWEEFATTGATGGGRNKVFYENDTTVTDSYTITTGKNAMSAGPISIGVLLTLTSISSDGFAISGTTDTDHDLEAGDSVIIAGTTNYNGTYVITTTPTSTTFTINDSLNVATESAGMIEKDVSVTVPLGSVWTVVGV
jgi:hypothetical protein